MSTVCRWCGYGYHEGSLYKKTGMHYVCHVIHRQTQERFGMSADETIRFHAPVSQEHPQIKGRQVICVTATIPGAAAISSPPSHRAGYRSKVDQVCGMIGTIFRWLKKSTRNCLRDKRNRPRGCGFHPER